MKSSALCSIFVAYFCILVVSNNHVFAQGSYRHLDDSTKQSSKFLTPGKADHWEIEGAENEVLYVSVATNQFDPVLSLIQINGGTDKVLKEVDDEGNTSRFRYRLPADGKYKIRVNGYDMKGGGHYTLSTRRFKCKPAKFGKLVKGKFDIKGKANFYFPAKEDQNLVIAARSANRVDIINESGGNLNYQWQSTFRVNQSEELVVSLSGTAGHNYEVLINEAQKSTLELGGREQTEAGEFGLNLWDIQAEPGQFRLVSISRHRELQTRLIYAPTDGRSRGLKAAEHGYSEIKFFPVSTKGKFTQFAVLFGRSGRYQLQSFAGNSVPIEVAMTDPTQSIERSQSSNQQLPIGDTRFYSFDAKAGELIQASLKSNRFDSVLRLYDQYGNQVAINDDDDDGLNSHLSYMIKRNGGYRWQISSVGNGGGGEYQMAFSNIKLKEAKIGSHLKSEIVDRETDYWELEGKRGQLIYVNVRSSDFYAHVEVYDPTGYRIANDAGSGIDNNSLAAVKLKRDGRYTIWVKSARKAGSYEMRLIDASWNK